MLRKNRDSPHGVSLLEVLIAMFVITIGMLGVAALIPTGHFAVVESTKADRAAACGRAGLSEVKVRRMLEPSLWAAFAPNASPQAWYPFSAVTTPEVWTDVARYGDTFVIDPLGVAANPGIAAMAAFPYDTLYPPPNWGLYYLHRVTGVGMSPAVADRIFTWGDALIFDVDSNDPESRTRGSFFWFDSVSGNTGAASYPVRSSDPPPLPPGTAVPLVQANTPDYTWMLTISPAPTEYGATDGFHKFQVSVIVFFKRDLPYGAINPSSPPTAEGMPAERSSGVILDGGGYGGGDVTIYLPVAMGNSLGFSDPSQYEAYLHVRPNQWIMLMGMKQDARVERRPWIGGGFARYRRVAQWYRVVMADDVPPDPVNINGQSSYYRRLTLAGPDWDPDSMLRNITRAVLVDGVIGVYTKSVDSRQ